MAPGGLLGTDLQPLGEAGARPGLLPTALTRRPHESVPSASGAFVSTPDGGSFQGFFSHVSAFAF